MAVADVTKIMHSFTIFKAEMAITVKYTITGIVGHNSNYKNL